MNPAIAPSPSSASPAGAPGAAAPAGAEPADAGPLAARGLPCRCFRPGPPTERVQLGRPEDAAGLVATRLAGADREHCLLVALDTKHRVIAISTVSVGTADHTFMGPREIYRDALLAGASAIVVAHNHPSGDPTPSADDRQITRRLAEAGTATGVELLDHLVVGDPEWVSLARLGVL